jgi:hypothetical protein
MNPLSPKYKKDDRVVVRIWLSGTDGWYERQADGSYAQTWLSGSGPDVSADSIRANLGWVRRTGTIIKVRQVSHIIKSVSRPIPSPWYKLLFDEVFPGCDAYYTQEDIIGPV